MILPCPTNVPCAGSDNPMLGYSSETPDARDFLSTGFAAVVPAVGNSSWTELSCMEFYTSTISQNDADTNASQQALLCALGLVSPYEPVPGAPPGGGLQPIIFFSAQASCVVTCPDGLPFTYTVREGMFFSSSSQLAADTAANTYACQQAAMRAICLSGVNPPTPLLNQTYTGTITATGGELAGPGQTNNWQLIAGSVPTGLTFNGGNLSGNTATITGTATATGTFAFTVQVTDPEGDTMVKTFTMTVSCANTATVTTNDGNAWVSVPPDAGYTTKYQIGTTGAPRLFVSFLSDPQKTWNFNWSFAGGHFSASLFVNGVSKPPGTGSFTTQGCNTPTVVEVLANGAGDSAQVVFFEWLTPS